MPEIALFIAAKLAAPFKNVVADALFAFAARVVRVLIVAILFTEQVLPALKSQEFLVLPAFCFALVPILKFYLV